jgi:4-hydroxy-4-methyl-2-oxoglutarate aldolase
MNEGRLDQCKRHSKAIAARESIMSKALMEGMPITHVMGADYEEMLKR